MACPIVICFKVFSCKNYKAKFCHHNSGHGYMQCIHCSNSLVLRRTILSVRTLEILYLRTALTSTLKIGPSDCLSNSRPNSIYLVSHNKSGACAKKDKKESTSFKKDEEEASIECVIILSSICKFFNQKLRCSDMTRSAG